MVLIGGGDYHQLELLPDEAVLLEDTASVWALPWPVTIYGRLCLTNRRLLWVRHHFSLIPWFRPAIEIRLEDARYCAAAGPKSAAQGGQAMVVETEVEVCVFNFFAQVGPLHWASASAASRWVSAISELKDKTWPDPVVDTLARRTARQRIRRIGIGIAVVWGLAMLNPLGFVLFFPLSPVMIASLTLMFISAIGGMTWTWLFFGGLEKSLRARSLSAPHG
jgi:hypothetical protein